MTDDLDILKAKLNQETAKADWRELQPFFARGQTVAVDPSLDLIEVAVSFSRDDASQIGQWKDAGLVDKVSDAQAAQWFDNTQALWTLVVMPWVLVQPCP
ncbi:hypothetical protein A11A3_05094 [Alcanivorax hongdengensis A-11-3]|uniref:DUF2288 domain-containing protein n=1 Tax=Alcanivorax hongdengensis A-11-3 TaxID=1177179 RepID=L0WDG0_9GAMM|nr:DUF2288 domain-containing protein [Alcanivorax hongdengensis]EKF75041.1 hypothetical protein A11A3_05094 [Alcanivorax hongdengensis A-11-3]